jgi:hypothetical protein
MRTNRAGRTRSTWLSAAFLAIAAGGCGGGGSDVQVVAAPEVSPTVNPDPRDRALGVNEKNEYLNLDKIRPQKPAGRR